MPSSDPYLEPVDEFPPYRVEVTAAGNSYGGGFIALASPTGLFGAVNTERAFDSVEEALQFVGRAKERRSFSRFFYYRIVDADGDVAWTDQPKPEAPEEPLPLSYKIGPSGLAEEEYDKRPAIAVVAPSLADAPTVDIRLGRPVADNVGRNRHPALDTLETGAGLGADSTGFFFRVSRDAARALADALQDAADESQEIAEAS